MLNIVENIKYI